MCNACDGVCAAASVIAQVAKKKKAWPSSGLEPESLCRFPDSPTEILPLDQLSQAGQGSINYIVESGEGTLG